MPGIAMSADAFFCAHGYFVDVGRQTPRFILFPAREDFHTPSRPAQKRPVFYARGHFLLLLTAYGGKMPFPRARGYFTTQKQKKRNRKPFPRARGYFASHEAPPERMVPFPARTRIFPILSAARRSTTSPFPRARGYFTYTLLAVGEKKAFSAQASVEVSYTPPFPCARIFPNAMALEEKGSSFFRKNRP